jgi:hypothetical protein
MNMTYICMNKISLFFPPSFKGSGIEDYRYRIRDKNNGRIRFRDEHLGSATLLLEAHN